MLAMFFFIALYMQNILRYSALEAGIRFLPSTVVIIFAAPIAGRLADRIGPRIPMTVGLAFVAVALYLQSTLTASSGYGDLLVPFMIMGLGMGLTMSPMSTAAMNSVSPDKAGVASGILSMSRMVGGSFGVAAMGALVVGIGRAKLDQLLPSLPAGQRASLAEALGAGGASRGGEIGRAMNEAFVSAVSVGLRVSAAMALAGAVLAYFLVAKKLPAAVPAADQALAAAPAGVAPQDERIAA
jgi:MFS family permease